MGERKHNHYFKSVAGLQDVDVYRVLLLFGVTDPCLQHAIKKLLVAGGRGGGKDISRDVQEAADTLARWQEMRREEAGHVLEPFCLAAEKQGPLMGASEGPASVRIPANEGYKAKC